MMRKKYMAGNWKMNLLPNQAESLVNELASLAPQHTQIIYFMPAPLLGLARQWNLGKAAFGSQNIYHINAGAFTGENSPELVRALGATYTLLGHSERRSLFGDHPEWLTDKVLAAWQNSLIPIFCVGESLDEREQGIHFQTVKNQLIDSLSTLIPFSGELIIAYEPVWAIGTGKTATPEQAVEMHQFIRTVLNQLQPDLGSKTSVLYGGSVSPSNAADLFSHNDIDGGLVGGASLKANDFKILVETQNQLLS